MGLVQSLSGATEPLSPALTIGSGRVRWQGGSTRPSAAILPAESDDQFH